MSIYHKNNLVKQPNFMAISYHNSWLKEIKNALGNKCSFLGHVRKETNIFKERFNESTGKRILPDKLIKDSEYFLEARFIDKKGIRNIKFKIEGTPSDVGNKNYLDLKKQLLDYARIEELI